MDTQPPVEGERGLGLEEVRGVLRRRRPLLIGVFLVIWGGVAAHTFLTPPVYEAAAALYIRAPGAGAISGLSSVLPAMGLLSGGTPSLESHQWLIMSPPFLEQAAREIGLGKPPGELLKMVRAEPVGDSLVVIYVADTNAGRAADFANKLAKLHEDQWEAAAQQGTDRASTFLHQQVGSTQKQLKRSEEALRQYQLDHGIVDLTAEAGKAVSVLGDLAAGVYTAQGETAGAQRTADFYRRQVENQAKTYVASSTIGRNPLVQASETALAQLETERASQAVLRGSGHYRMKQLDEQIAQTKAELAKAVHTVVASQVQSDNPLWTTAAQALATAEAEVHAGQAKQSALQQILDREMKRWRDVPNLQTDIGRLQRDTVVESTVYADLLKSYYETCLKQLQDQSVVEVVDPATKPDRPVRPRKVLYLVLGFLLAVLLGSMAVVAAEVFGDTLRSARQAQIELGPRALASVPTVRRGSPLLARRGPRQGSRLLDIFRNLRTSLRYAVPGGLPKVLLVTGSSRQDGATTIAANLGVVLAQQGLRTLLVDGNLRRPALHQAAAVPGEHGLSDLLIGDADPLTFVQPTETQNLSVLPGGDTPPNPAELLESGRAQAVMAVLRERFDAIVVDSPAHPYPDVLPLAALCDASLLVIRLGSSRRSDARAAADQLAIVGKPPIGLVVNRC